MSLYVDLEKQLDTCCLRVHLETGGQRVGLLGASGCGKTMTLKCIAGLVRPDRGRIVLNGRVLFDSDHGIDLPPQKRQVGYLFQQYALFPHMTVAQNLAAGVRGHRQAARRVPEMLRIMGLEHLADRYPAALSGGEQQRVALARMLLSEPELLLLDEPFSALDSHLRRRMERELGQILGQFGKEVVMVSHDREELFRMSDEIALMDRGQLVRHGEKRQVFADPGTEAGAQLTGCENFSRAVSAGPGQVQAPDWGAVLVVPGNGRVDSLGIRARDFALNGTENRLHCAVRQVEESTDWVSVVLLPQGGTRSLIWETRPEIWTQMRSQEVDVFLPPEKLLRLTVEKQEEL